MTENLQRVVLKLLIKNSASDFCLTIEKDTTKANANLFILGRNQEVSHPERRRELPEEARAQQRRSRLVPPLERGEHTNLQVLGIALEKDYVGYQSINFLLCLEMDEQHHFDHRIESPRVAHLALSLVGVPPVVPIVMAVVGVTLSAVDFD